MWYRYQVQQGFVGALLLLGGGSTSAAHPLQGSHAQVPLSALSRRVDYKETTICETTPGVRGYSGYVHQNSNDFYPAGALGGDEYEISTFFWYFRARKTPDKAPLLLWFGGGPGDTSLYGATVQNGPCYVGSDSNSTYFNPESFNEFSNVLYIDQPVFVGFSYDEVTNASYNFLSMVITPVEEYGDDPPAENATFKYGMYGSQNPRHTPNTTTSAARIMYDFLQIWLDEFPKHRTSDDRLILATNSYGGWYGPNFFSYFLSKQDDIKAGRSNDRPLNLDTLAITNGCMDALYQAPYYPQFAVNNTYNRRLLPDSLVEAALFDYDKPGGLVDQITLCRMLAEESDPDDIGHNETVNELCLEAEKYYATHFFELMVANNQIIDRFDIAQRTPGVLGPHYTTTFFQQAWVQRHLGTPLNLTDFSLTVPRTIFSTADAVRQQGVPTIARLLDAGIKVALIFGDRDYVCNWMGGQNISASLPWYGRREFAHAGYADIQVNSSYVGGLVRQHGPLSFARVFQAGHDVGWFQPETVRQIVQRAADGLDIATGQVAAGPSGSGRDYSSSGIPDAASVVLELPDAPEKPMCYYYDLFTCTPEQIEAIKNGTAVFKDFVVVEPSRYPPL